MPRLAGLLNRFLMFLGMLATGNVSWIQIYIYLFQRSYLSSTLVMTSATLLAQNFHQSP